MSRFLKAVNLLALRRRMLKPLPKEDKEVIITNLFILDGKGNEISADEFMQQVQQQRREERKEEDGK